MNMGLQVYIGAKNWADSLIVLPATCSSSTAISAASQDRTSSGSSYNGHQHQHAVSRPLREESTYGVGIGEFVAKPSLRSPASVAGAVYPEGFV